MPEKVALVTGGASGIGRAISIRLAEDGYTVVIVDRNSLLIDDVIESITRNSGRAYKQQIDVTNEEALSQLFQNWAANYGRLDVLINNAAMSKPKPLVDTEPALWDAVMDVNLKGVYTCCRLAYPLLKYGGNVVNISSIQSQSLAEGNAAYGISKAGVNYLTRVLAKEWLKDRIRVNAVLPAGVDTPLFREVVGVNSEEALRKLETSIEEGEIQTSEQIAGVVSLLLRPEASIITGTCLVADGGSQLR
ncbi:SDR family NAD(P)-dependent oxidoreductase [Paenibacillus sp. Soil787]|uniref:SDR family NAD(P)-dependent oxidoreductase n=1 Tax=Paenibacillus sp. Soil787 TaxID=1736411 RepID=UPI0006FCD21B|nr:SDR family oxidoreductase [Paenibacillus sp. Soil787]KRF39122.1 hypothetical protein ASG93_23440 [Paenibacillus sp. Soil787]